jgi:hypothetical protein
MYWRAAIVSMLLVAAGAPAAHAVEITTYGTGLKSCRAYLDTREKENIDEVAFIDWLGGYLSGVNTTSNHRNNILSHSDFQAAMYWLDDYCRAHPLVHFADAAGVLLMGAKAGPAAHSVEVTAYGSGYKSCGVYLAAREQQNQNVDGAQFVAWLGGYVSGVNAISLSTNNILGESELIDAVYWLDKYCSAHPQTLFGVAVEVAIAANHSDKAVAANQRDK